MKRFTILVLIFATMYGCQTTPKVESTKPWEGHYMSTNDFQKSTSNIQLDSGESIWVMSNATLKRLLKNVGK